MQELNVNELKEVNGGFINLAAGYAAGKAFDAASEWVSDSYEQYVREGNRIEHSMVW